MMRIFCFDFISHSVFGIFNQAMYINNLSITLRAALFFWGWHRAAAIYTLCTKYSPRWCANHLCQRLGTECSLSHGLLTFAVGPPSQHRGVDPLETKLERRQRSCEPSGKAGKAAGPRWKASLCVNWRIHGLLLLNLAISQSI